MQKMSKIVEIPSVLSHLTKDTAKPPILRVLRPPFPEKDDNYIMLLSLLSKSVFGDFLFYLKEHRRNL